MRNLIDTGPLVALLNRRDAYHAWSVDKAAALPPPFFTCEAVLAEAHFLLARVHQGTNRFIDLIASGRLKVSFSFAESSFRVGELMRAYSDVPMSFADACLVCMDEQEEARIFTVDSDFRIYRKHGKKSLQLIIP